FFGTNGFGSRSNRFRGTNDFGGRTNRFGTNDFGNRTNRFFTNEFGFTNSVDISNEIELGLSPGAVVAPGGAVATAVPGVVTPAPAAAAPNQQTPLTPTGNPAADNRVFGAAGGSTNRTGIALRDQSVTEADRALLQNLRQLVVPRLEAMGAWGQAV